MPTISIDFRVVSRNYNAFIRHVTLRRGLEFNVIESVRTDTLKRGIEYKTEQSFATVEIPRGIEFDMAGFLEHVFLERGIEYEIVEIPNFESDHSRLVILVKEPLEEVLVQARELTYVHNPRYNYLETIRVNSKVSRPSAVLPFQLVFSNLGLLNQKINDQREDLPQVDAALQFGWAGTFDQNDRFAVAYRVNSGPIQPIDKSLPITTSRTPTLSWSAITNPESSTQDIEYVIQLSDSYTMKRFIAEIVTDQTSIQLAEHGVILDYNKTYYWRVRTRDYWNSQLLDESDWTNILSFDVKESIITSIPNILDVNIAQSFWTNPYLLEPFQLQYIWNTQNLPSRDNLGNYYSYEFIVQWYRFTSGLPELVSEVASFPFYVNHTAANPPIFLSANYDEQQRHIVFQIQINDSLGRKYQLKDFQYFNREDITSQEWLDIEDQRIIGLKTNLNSTPTNNNRGIITWDGSYDAEYPNYQELDYNLRVLKEPVNRNNNFYYALQLINNDEIEDILSIGSKAFGIYWGTKFNKSHFPTFIDPHIGTEFRVLPQSKYAKWSQSIFGSAVWSDENFGQDDEFTIFNFPFQFVSKSFTLDLKYSYLVKHIRLILNDEMDIESVISLELTYYNNGVEIATGSYGYLIKDNIIQINFEVDKIILRFTCNQYPKLDALEVNGVPLFGSVPITSNDLTFVDTETTDIVMKNFVIDPSNHFTNMELGSFGFPDSGILPPFTYYGLNSIFRVFLFRDKNATELLYAKSGVKGNPNIVLTNLEMFYENITNVILEFKNIPFTFYELSYEDAQMIDDKIGDQDYWIQVRSRDYYRDGEGFKTPIEYSPWSGFAIRRPSNIYMVKWNVKGMRIDPTKSLYFRCKAVLASLNKQTEIPIVGFLPKANAAINELNAESLANQTLVAQTQITQTELQDNINSVITEDSITLEF